MEKRKRLDEKIHKIVTKYINKWHEANRTKERFESYFRNWLDGEFGIEEFIEQEQCVASTSASGTKRGRPSKPFLDLSERGKRRVIDKEAVDPKFDTIEKALLFARRTAYNRKDFNLVKVIGHI